MTKNMMRFDVCTDYCKGIEMDTKCEDCKYYNRCGAFDYEDCKGCPMHYGSRFSTYHCHCCAYITRDELKQKKCKFFIQKEDN